MLSRLSRPGDDGAHAVAQRARVGDCPKGLPPSAEGGEKERSTDSGNPVSAPGV